MDIINLKSAKNTVNPTMIQDDFMGDYYLGCPECKEKIFFPHIRDLRPRACESCGARFDWSERKETI